MSGASAVTRTPLYFGEPSRPLFGWYHEPASHRRGDLALVICPPLGHEYINSHRALRHLADRCASMGVPSFRFDYDGTGDSAGVDEDPDRLAAWQRSLHAAIAVARRLSGCRETGLAGLRFGATLAALASLDTDVSVLALWAPCVKGRGYLRELKAAQLAASAPGALDAAESGDIEAGGFVYTEHTQRDIGRVNLESLVPRAERILIASRDDLAEAPALRAAWSGQGLRVDHLQLPGYADMMVEAQYTKVPHAAISQLAEWIGAGQTLRDEAPTRHATTHDEAPQSAVLTTQPDAPEEEHPEILERIVSFGGALPRFGIVSEPAHASARPIPTVVLPNAGATHHVGPNRLHVLLARAMARAGFRCFRFDLAGLGDSPTDDPAGENQVYPPASSTEIAEALDTLTATRAAGPFVVMGLCSGAHSAFHAGLDLAGQRITECVLINPLTYYYKPGMSLSQPSHQHHLDWQYYRTSMRSPARWLNLELDAAKLSKILSIVAAQVRMALAARMRSWRRRWVPLPANAPAGDNLEADLLRLLSSGRTLTFVFSRMDPGFALLTTEGGVTARRLIRQGRIGIRFVELADHTFAARHARSDFIGIVVRHIAGGYGSMS